jgi:hypothetical protein
MFLSAHSRRMTGAGNQGNNRAHFLVHSGKMTNGHGYRDRATAGEHPPANTRAEAALAIRSVAGQGNSSRVGGHSGRAGGTRFGGWRREGPDRLRA